MQFKNRRDAAEQLISLLQKYKHEPGLVLAVPRGGVPVAYHVAKDLGLPLELLMTKKIGHPAYPELAIGAVSPEGHVMDQSYGIPESYLEDEVKRLREHLAAQYHKFMGNHQPAEVKNKTAIIIDDGVATGHTLLAAIKMLKQKNPKKIIVAVPVAPPETADRIKKQVDDFICLHTPLQFVSVSRHYEDFQEVSDEEVTRFLRGANQFESAA
jgi:predicted phosphoribosyltransferase